MLGPLADNGGPTLDDGSPSRQPRHRRRAQRMAPEFDQRGPGFPRIVNDTIDIGAFEVQATGAPASTWRFCSRQISVEPRGEIERRV